MMLVLRLKRWKLLWKILARRGSSSSRGSNFWYINYKRFGFDKTINNHFVDSSIVSLASIDVASVIDKKFLYKIDLIIFKAAMNKMCSKASANLSEDSQLVETSMSPAWFLVLE